MCLCVCVWGGARAGDGGIINTRKIKITSYDIRLSLYNDGVRPVEMKRSFGVEEKLVCTVYI